MSGGIATRRRIGGWAGGDESAQPCVSAVRRRTPADAFDAPEHAGNDDRRGADAGAAVRVTGCGWNRTVDVEVDVAEQQFAAVVVGARYTAIQHGRSRARRTHLIPGEAARVDSRAFWVDRVDSRGIQRRAG